MEMAFQKRMLCKHKHRSLYFAYRKSFSTCLNLKQYLLPFDMDNMCLLGFVDVTVAAPPKSQLV